MTERKVAFFDIDKTIYNGYVISPLAQHQVEQGIIKQTCLDDLNSDFIAYKEGSAGYEETIDILNRHWAQGLKGESFDKVLDDARNFFNTDGNKFYGYLLSVIDLLSPTHDIYFITGEPQFVALAAKSKYPKVETRSSELEIVGGIFTGRVTSLLAYRMEKKRAIAEIIQNYDKEDAFAFGDSEGDIEMLSSVDNPICINPSEGLLRIAEEKGWLITTPKEVESIVRQMLSE